MAADPDHVAAARRILDELGVTVADLALTQGRRHVPTIGDYLPQVRAAAGSGAVRTYGSYWSQMAIAWGDRPLTAITASDVEALQRRAIADAVPRRSSRGGRHAGEHLIAAARAMFNRPSPTGTSPLATVPHTGS